MIERVRSTGGGAFGVQLSDDVCAFLAATTAQDLGLLEHFFEIPVEIPRFFSQDPLDSLVLPGVDFNLFVDRLFQLQTDADTYFFCLAVLHKSRLKYDRILRAQPLPTWDQVGPRALLQYGTISARALSSFILWRKWIYDIDNRAGQETGYLFEPIIAQAIGGAAFGARTSPIRRYDDPTRGRQVDCVREGRAYEIKIRVTIAASGQGRWREELAFPRDCRTSHFTPVLVVLDPTPNPKLTELTNAFLAQDGEVYVGDAAWTHLEEVAGHTMASFLNKYVKEPLQSISKAVPTQLPRITFEVGESQFVVTIENETFIVPREGIGVTMDEGEIQAED